MYVIQNNVWDFKHYIDIIGKKNLQEIQFSINQSMEAMTPCIEERIICSWNSDVVMPQNLICHTANSNESYCHDTLVFHIMQPERLFVL